jgi:hypothetical protein
MNPFDYIKYLPLIIQIAPDLQQLLAKGGPLLDALAKTEPELVPILKRIVSKIQAYQETP